VFWVLPGAVEEAGVMLDEPEAAESVEDEVVTSEALLAFLECLKHPWLAFTLTLACLKARYLYMQCPGCSQK